MKNVLRVIGLKKLLDAIKEGGIPCGIVRPVTSSKLLECWEVFITPKSTDLPEKIPQDAPQGALRKTVKEAPYRRKRCHNSSHIMYFTPRQFNLIRGKTWYWYPKDLILDENGTNIRKYLKISKKTRGLFDFRPKKGTFT